MPRLVIFPGVVAEISACLEGCKVAGNCNLLSIVCNDTFVTATATGILERSTTTFCASMAFLYRANTRPIVPKRSRITVNMIIIFFIVMVLLLYLVNKIVDSALCFFVSEAIGDEIEQRSDIS